MLDRIMQNILTVSNAPNSNSLKPLNQMKNSVKNSVSSNSKNIARDQTGGPNFLKASIWETESTQEMFDFENNKNVKVMYTRIDGINDIYMMRPENRHARCVVVKSGVFNDNLYCGKIDNSKGTCSMVPGGQIEAYRVVDNFTGVALKVGGMVKIGRMHYYVKEIYNGISTKIQESIKSEIGSQQYKKTHIKSLSKGACKFCLCDENECSDILISPCSCKGSCAQVHLECLKQWLINKVSRKSTPIVDYLNYDNFNCELCKDELPTTLNIDGKVYNILNDSKETKDPYIILEGLPNSKSSTKNNIVLKIKFPSKNTKHTIGRGHQADIRLEDVSISRQHCFIYYADNQIMLKDNRSKFGSLVKLTAGQRIEMKPGMKIQMGRMILQIQKQQSNKIYGENGR